jgi:hypothetical protein
MYIRKVAKVLFCISQNKSDEDIIKIIFVQVGRESMAYGAVVTRVRPLSSEFYGAVVTRVRPLSSERAVPVPCKINDVKTKQMSSERAVPVPCIINDVKTRNQWHGWWLRNNKLYLKKQ